MSIEEDESMNQQEFITAFARAITRWRKRLDMSAEDFAAFIGVSRNSVLNYENGQAMPTLYTAMLIAERLGVSLDDLLHGK